MVSSFVGMELTWEEGITPLFYSESSSEKNSSMSDEFSLLSISSKRVLMSIPYDFEATRIASKLSISNLIFSPNSLHAVVCFLISNCIRLLVSSEASSPDFESGSEDNRSTNLSNTFNRLFSFYLHQ